MNDLLTDRTLDRHAAPGTWFFHFEALLPTGNLVMRMNHFRYRKLLEEWFYRIRTAPCFAEISRPKGKRYLLVIRHSPKTSDEENLSFSVKPLRDVLRPAAYSSGVYKSGPKKGQPWQRSQMGHGLILDDSPQFCALQTIQRLIPHGRRGYTTVVLSDFPINPDDF